MEKKKTYTYTTFPAFKKNAESQAARENTTLSEAIGTFVAKYGAKKGPGTKAVEAIVSVRLLKAHGIITEEQSLDLKSKVMKKFGIYLSPLRDQN